MPWTLRDLMSESTTMAGVGSLDILPSRVSFYVNAAFRDLATRIPPVEMERIAVSSTSSGENSIFLPLDCERLLSLSLTTGVTGEGGQGLRQTNVWEIDAQSMGTQTGIPLMFLSYATWIQLYPSPNSQYSLQLRYVARYSDITNLDSIPSVDTRYHPAGLFKTVELLALRKADAATANVFRQRYEAELTNQPGPLTLRGRDRLGYSARFLFQEE